MERAAHVPAEEDATGGAGMSPMAVEIEPIPDWLRSASGALGPHLVGLRRDSGVLLLEVETGATGPLFLTFHRPDAPRLPFACAAFAVGYRHRPESTELQDAEVCRRFGEAVLAVPGASERLSALVATSYGSLADSLAPSEANTPALRALREVERGNVVAGLAAWNVAVKTGLTPGVASRASPFFSLVLGHSQDGKVPPPLAPEQPSSRAWALAWSGDLEGARRLAEASPETPESSGVLGVVAVLERRSEEAVALLDRAIEGGGSQELLLHRARALVHLGRVDEADRALTRLLETESLGQRVLKALIVVRRGPLLPTFRRWRRRVSRSDYHFGGLFSSELPALVGNASLDRALGSRATLLEFLEGLLDRMAGNLGRSPTLAARASDGQRSFVRVALPPRNRTLAVEALHSLRHVGAERAEAALGALLAEEPRSVHAYTHRGELYLWLGRYEDARRDFEAARRIESVRWADIGILAALVFTGATRRARLAALYARLHFVSSIQGSTLPVYRGVLWRRIGHFERAIEDLGAAVAIKPTRIGARMELCLALRAAGRAGEASTHAAIVFRDAAPLLVDAADAVGLDWGRDPARLMDDHIFEEALRSMRGNRSSALVTWLDRSHRLRVLTPIAGLQGRAAQLCSAFEGSGVA